jgi:GH25 family lysozyme M1 (1,4-beta-N-acetylmuramidase)
MGPPNQTGHRRSLLVTVALAVAALAVVAAALPAGAATGVDVASWQHPNGAAIDWRQVRAAGHTFAYVKSTEGTSYVNPYFASDWAGIRNAGLLRGTYHYARPAWPLSTAVDQARFFASVAGPQNGSGDLPPVLDLEETGGLGATDVVNWARTWLEEVRRLTGRDPMIYLGYYFWKDTLRSTTALAGYRLWLPWYTSAAAPGATPAPWGGWTFWQYTETGRVPGIVGNADVNRFCCPDANLSGLLGGSNAAAGNPFGSFDAATRLPGTVRLSGWAIDPDTTGPVDVHVYVDGAIAGSVRADADRPDVGRTWPGWGDRHGFAADLAVPAGARRVCAYAINTRSGTTNPLLGCRDVVAEPMGSLDRVSSPRPGTVEVVGWALDADTTGPVDVRVHVDGAPVGVVRTGDPRPDVDTALGLAAPAGTGFSGQLPNVAPGRHQVCAYAVNVGAGSDRAIGCNPVDVLGSNPIGSLDGVTAGVGTLDVEGWALDGDVTGPVDVHVYVDGRFAGATSTTQTRLDVAAVHPTYGSTRGYRLRVDGVGGGGHQVCAYALNVGPGDANPLLGCRTVQSPADPVGTLDEVTTDGRLRVRGWAIDPDTTDPIDVHVYVDGRFSGAITAGESRPDVGAAYPRYGPAHGYSADLPGVEDGRHEVCVYGIDVGPGANRLLECRTVRVTGTPFGSFDDAARLDATTARVRGWAIDPDTTAPIEVRIAVDGVVVGTATAGADRPDVGAAFPGFGSAHGFVVDVPVGPRTRYLCLAAVNVGAGTLDPFLGCRPV